MPGGEATNEERLLKNLRNAPNTAGAVLEIFNQSVPTGTAQTSTNNLFIGGARDITIMIDMTGSVATAVAVPTIEIRGGISGFGFALIRTVTATADQTITFGLQNQNSGGAGDTTGLVAFNDLQFVLHPSGTVTAGNVTFVGRAIFPKV